MYSCVIITFINETVINKCYNNTGVHGQSLINVITTQEDMNSH